MTDDLKNKSKRFIIIVKQLLSDGVFKNQNDVANSLQISVANLSLFLRGNRNVSYKAMLNLEEFLKSKGLLNYSPEGGSYKNYSDFLSKANVIKAVRNELINNYGGLGKGMNGEELQIPYMVLGIVTEALNKI